MFLFNLVFLSFCIAPLISLTSFCADSYQQIDMAAAIAKRLPERMRSLINTGKSVNAPLVAGLMPLDAVLSLQSPIAQNDYPHKIKEMLSILILHGAHIDSNNMLHRNAYTYVTGTPEQLLLAASYAESIPHLSYALEKGACNQVEALCYAAYRGMREIAQVLLDYKTPVNQPNVKGHVPLEYATAGNHTALVSLLLKHGAQSTGLANLLEYATTRGNKKMVQKLIKSGAPLSKVSTTQALLSENYELLRTLLEAGAPLPLCSTLRAEGKTSQTEKHLNYELRVRELSPLEKRLNRLLIEYGGVLLESSSANTPINIITLRVLFDNKLLQEAFLNNRLAWYVYCLLRHVLQGEQAQVSHLVNNSMYYLPRGDYNNEEFGSYIATMLENYATTFMKLPPNFAIALREMSGLIKASRLGYVVPRDQLVAVLEKIAFLAKDLNIENKQVLLKVGSSIATQKIINKALCAAAIRGYSELLDLIAPFVDSKTLLRALALMTISMQHLENS